MSWIKVKMQEPELYTAVNVYGRRGNELSVTTATFHGDYWWDRVFDSTIDVTHWRPLPPKPNE